MKRILSVITVLVLSLSLVACGNKENSSSIPATSSETVQEVKKVLNPLTGLSDFDATKINQRPVAVMINNISLAQDVQAGLSQADIVYEAYAEGGITRFLAVFKDISKVPKVGTIRSARYSYVDLALGHDALYVHAGQDPTFCTQRIKETGIDDFNLLTGQQSNYGKRISNGKATEHTLYTTGELINQGFEKLKYRRDLKSTPSNWQAFAAEDEQVGLTGGSCEKVVVTMSSSYISTFTYDSASMRYKRSSGSTKSMDINTKSQISFKNVLVLKTDVSYLNSAQVSKTNYLMKTGLVGGDGYYFTNGNYVPVKWSKGAATNPIKVTLADGSECTFNAGNTWVSLVDKTHAVDITGAPVTTSSVAAVQ